jgi:hypothetical protein
MIIFFDFFFFVLLVCQYGLGYEETVAMGERMNDDEYVSAVNAGLLQINLFNILTDGICILLQGIKTYYGLKYLRIVSFPPKIEY